MRSLLLSLSLLFLCSVTYGQTSTRSVVQTITNPSWMSFYANYPHTELALGGVTLSDGQIVVKWFNGQVKTYLVPVADTDLIKSQAKYSLADAPTMMSCSGPSTLVGVNQYFNNSCRFRSMSIYQTVVTGSPSPTPAPTATPPVLVSPSPTPSATPKPTPVATPIPTPTPVPTPSATVITNSISTSSYPFYYYYSASKIGVRFSGSSAVLTFVSNHPYEMIVSATDGQEINSAGYSGQSASMTLQCKSNIIYLLDNGYGWWFRSNCRLARFSFVK